MRAAAPEGCVEPERVGAVGVRAVIARGLRVGWVTSGGVHRQALSLLQRAGAARARHGGCGGCSSGINWLIVRTRCHSAVPSAACDYLMRRVYAKTGNRCQREGSGECGEGARKGLTGEKITHSLVERQGPPAKRGLQEREAGREGGGREKEGKGGKRSLGRATASARPSSLPLLPPPPPLPFPFPLSFPASCMSPYRELRGGCFPSSTWKCGILYHCTQSSTAQLPISLVDQRLSSLREVLLSLRNTVGWFDSHLAWSSTQSCSCCCKSAFSSS